MAVVLDTSIVVALAVAEEPEHAAVADWLLHADEDLVTTPLVLAEIDHVITRRADAVAAARVFRDFERGAYQVRWWADAIYETLRIYRVEHEIGIVDASLVALAERLRTTRLATLDQRHFRRVKTRDGEHFTILPADA